MSGLEPSVTTERLEGISWGDYAGEVTIENHAAVYQGTRAQTWLQRRLPQARECKENPLLSMSLSLAY